MHAVLQANQAPSSELHFLNGRQERESLVAEVKAQLAWRGWTVVTDVAADAAVMQILSALGTLLPQYTGELTYEVKALSGFENFQYSQSANTIQPHTEAPVYTPPPRYLALQCRRQARCGAGHTLLADGFAFIQTLPQDLRAQATTRLINFSGFCTPKGGANRAPSVMSPVLSVGNDGTPILRFSYNVFRYNNLHPSLEMDSRVDYSEGDAFFKAMCERAHVYFETNNVAVLIPDGGVLIFDNHRMLHARSAYKDQARHLTRYWVGDANSVTGSGVEE